MKKIGLLALLILAYFSCSKNEENEDCTLSADINNIERHFEGYAQVDYNYEKGYHITMIHTFNKKFEDGMLRDIYITINLPPKIGEFKFNNELILLNDAGATFRIWNLSSDNTYYSIDGYVDISKFTKTNIMGSFKFKAISNNTRDTVFIDNGEFYCCISAVSGKEWNGLN